MFERAQLVCGAAASRDFVPVLTHVNIHANGMQATNGRVTIEAPCDVPVQDVNVPAKRLLQALKAARGEVAWSTTRDNRLQLSAGRLRVRLPISTEPFPRIQEPDHWHKLDTALFGDVLPLLRPFVAQDGSKVWACGALLHPEGLVYATNNVILARAECALPEVLDVPKTVNVEWLDEGLRLTRLLGQPPDLLAWGDTWVAVKWFRDGTWLHGSTLAEEWPSSALEMVPPLPADPGSEHLADLYDAVRAVVPFSADEKAPAVLLNEQGVQTIGGNTVEAVLVAPDLYPEGRYRAEVLNAVLTAADRVWLDRWPDPVPFAGPHGLTGIFVGIR